MNNIITNLKVYDIEETMVASGYAMVDEYDEFEVQWEAKEIIEDDIFCTYDKENKHYKRGMRLTKADLNSGHPNFLSGFLVSMDVTFTNKVWVEWQRYHFQQIVTSQSTMHRLSKFHLDEAFIEYVDSAIIARIKELQERYNETKDKKDYLTLLYSCPSGLKLTARTTTNYLQLMTMYKQRRNHRLPEWQQFCQDLIDKLPLFYDYLEINGALDSKDKRGE